MILRDPSKVREMLAKQKNWLTHGEIAKGLGMAALTVRRLFRGERVQPTVMRKVAEAIGVDVVSIAYFAKKKDNH